MTRPCSPTRLLAVMVLAGASFAAAAQTGAAVEIDHIVAVVNDDVIVRSELDARLREVQAQLRQSGTPAPAEQALERQVLDRLILDRLQLQMARRNGIRVEEAELNQALERIAKGNQLTVRQFRDVLARDGLEFSAFREQVRNEILLTRVRQRRQIDAARLTA